MDALPKARRDKALATAEGCGDSMKFAPISIDDYVPRYVAANPGANARDARDRLQEALTAFRAGRRCDCGQPIWVIGSAEAGYACFTCITGEARPNGDYELSEALSLGPT